MTIARVLGISLPLCALALLFSLIFQLQRDVRSMRPSVYVLPVKSSGNEWRNAEALLEIVLKHCIESGRSKASPGSAAASDRRRELENDGIVQWCMKKKIAVSIVSLNKQDGVTPFESLAAVCRHKGKPALAFPVVGSQDIMQVIDAAGGHWLEKYSNIAPYKNDYILGIGSALERRDDPLLIPINATMDVRRLKSVQMAFRVMYLNIGGSTAHSIRVDLKCKCGSSATHDNALPPGMVSYTDIIVPEKAITEIETTGLTFQWNASSTESPQSAVYAFNVDEQSIAVPDRETIDLGLISQSSTSRFIGPFVATGKVFSPQMTLRAGACGPGVLVDDVTVDYDQKRFNIVYRIDAFRARIDDSGDFATHVSAITESKSGTDIVSCRIVGRFANYITVFPKTVLLESPKAESKVACKAEAIIESDQKDLRVVAADPEHVLATIIGKTLSLEIRGVDELKDQFRTFVIISGERASITVPVIGSKRRLPQATPVPAPTAVD